MELYKDRRHFLTQAAEHNRLEILRDPSHTRGLPVGELVDLLRQAGPGVKIDEDKTAKTPLEVGMDVVAWMESTKTSDENQKEIIKAFEADLNGEGPSTGMNAYRDEETKNICFKHKWAVVVGIKE